MKRNVTTKPTQLPINDFFGWKYHPFADTYVQRQLWLPERDCKQLETIKRLLHNGKSTALCALEGRAKPHSSMPFLPILTKMPTDLC